MSKHSIPFVPRNDDPLAKDCLVNTYGSVISYMGHEPSIVLADYLCFMFEEETGVIGCNHLYEYYATLEFSEEQLNSSMEMVYFSPTRYYEGEQDSQPVKQLDKINIHWYIHDDYSTALDRTKQLLDDGRPVIVFVDMYYMPYHEYYLTKHQTHSVVITGYDDELRRFEVFDMYQIGQCHFDGTLSYDEMRLARTSEVPVQNPLVGEHVRRYRHLWIEFAAAPEFEITSNRVASIIKESCERMSGERQVLGLECGLKRIEALRNNILNMAESELDERKLFMLHQYYMTNFRNLGRGRQRFKFFIEQVSHLLPQETVPLVTECLQQSSQDWFIASNVSLKAAMTRKKHLLESLAGKLFSIIEHESKAIQYLREVVCQPNMIEK